MKILECRTIREQELLKLKKNMHKKTTLAVIQIGFFKENEIYLKAKRKLALELGIELIEFQYDKDSDKEEIISKIIELNSDKEVTGIMIQKPILSKFDYQEFTNYIDYRKDVDGITKINQERLQKKDNCIIPCTVRAILMMLNNYKILIEKRKIAIIGKSELVGMPLYYILKDDHEVILCDSKTVNLKEVLKEVDVIISAIGRAHYFDESYFQEAQIIIDVGTNYLDGKLVGDVDFEKVKENVSMITPVPGGIGVLTPICLFLNLTEMVSG